MLNSLVLADRITPHIGKSEGSGMSAPPTSSSESPAWPNLDECYALTKEALGAQLAQSHTLDSKASFVLTSASVLTAAALALHQAVTNLAGSVAASSQPEALAVTAKILGILGVLAYVGVVYTSFRAYTLRSYAGPADPRQLEEKYVDMDVQLAKATIFSTMVESYTTNSAVLERKVLWTRYALYALLAEAALVALITLVEIFL
jgi:hypothetical protein